MKTIIKAIKRPRKTWNNIKYWSIGKRVTKMYSNGYLEIEEYE